ncbi:hypothetical protein KCU65_g4371, partial [Aureobasidium melanogenum]
MSSNSSASSSSSRRSPLAAAWQKWFRILVEYYILPGVIAAYSGTHLWFAIYFYAWRRLLWACTVAGDREVIYKTHHCEPKKAIALLTIEGILTLLIVLPWYYCFVVANIWARWFVKMPTWVQQKQFHQVDWDTGLSRTCHKCLGHPAMLPRCNMRLYLILAALAVCCQTSHAVNIDPLPDCIKDCMRENKSYFNVEKKKAKHICGVTCSGRFEKWCLKYVEPCADEVCPGTRDSPQHTGNGIKIFAKVTYPSDENKMQLRNLFYLAALVMVAAKSPPEDTIKIQQWSPCMQRCMREHSYNFNIEHSTVEYMCIGGHAAQRWIAWVRDGLEHCLWWNCAMERDDKEIEDLWAWYRETCKPLWEKDGGR